MNFFTSQFYKLDVKALAASKGIRCVRCSQLPSNQEHYRSVSTKARIVLAQAKEVPGTSLRINTVCNFYTMKSE